MFNRIIHIAQEEKFINSANWQFENAFPNKNIFYIYQYSNDIDLIHVAKLKNVNIIITKEDKDALLKSIVPNDIVVFHSLQNDFFSLILKLPISIKCIWLCFGFEVYNDTYYFSENRLLDKITKKQFSIPKQPFEKRVKENIHIRSYYRLIKSKLPLSSVEIQRRNKREVMDRINYLGCGFEEEHKNITKLIRIKKKTFPFWYFPIERIVDVNEEISLNKPNILIGNSGFKTGNHLDVFNKIKNYDFEKRKIIVPLNYGDKSYIQDIIELGNNIFSDKFHPLTTFFELPKYNQIIQNCGVAILNNRRQQAVGNTIALLWYGSKVYLSKKNTFYKYLKRIGVLIFSYENDLSERSLNELLTYEQIEYNRNILFINLNSELLLKELKLKIETIY